MDVNKVLKIVTSNPVLEASRETGIGPTDLMKFYNSLESLLKNDIPYGEIGDELVFVVALDGNAEDAGAKLNLFLGNDFVSKIKENLFRKGNVLIVNYKGYVVEQIENSFINDYVQAAKLSEEKFTIVFFIQFRAVHFFVNGKPIDYIHDILQSNREGVKTPKSLPAREYRQLIKNQYSDMIYKQKAVTYWDNKLKRVLKDKPEVLFHRPLWWYLSEYIDNGKVDSGATIAGTEDRTDIRILAFDGKLYIIEIKCLGKTKSGTYYSDDWANEGLIQINQYLNDESDSTKGTLVLYDGRKENKRIAWCSAINCSPKYDNDPMRFYLESESASVKAKKTLSNLKRKPLSG